MDAALGREADQAACWSFLAARGHDEHQVVQSRGDLDEDFLRSVHGVSFSPSGG